MIQKSGTGAYIDTEGPRIENRPECVRGTYGLAVILSLKFASPASWNPCCSSCKSRFHCARRRCGVWIAVMIEAVDERLTAQDKRLDRRFATQNRRIYGVERKVDKAITKLDAVLKEVQAHQEEDVTGAEQLRRHDDQLQDHAVRIKTLEAIRN